MVGRLTVEDPASSESALHGLRIPNLRNQAALLASGSDKDLKLIDLLGGILQDVEGIQGNLAGLAKSGGRRTSRQGRGQVLAADTTPCNLPQVDVLAQALGDFESATISKR